MESPSVYGTTSCCCAWSLLVVEVRSSPWIRRAAWLELVRRRVLGLMYYLGKKVSMPWALLSNEVLLLAWDCSKQGCSLEVGEMWPTLSIVAQNQFWGFVSHAKALDVSVSSPDRSHTRHYRVAPFETWRVIHRPGTPKA